MIYFHAVVWHHFKFDRMLTKNVVCFHKSRENSKKWKRRRWRRRQKAALSLKHCVLNVRLIANASFNESFLDQSIEKIINECVFSSYEFVWLDVVRGNSAFERAINKKASVWDAYQRLYFYFTIKFNQRWMKTTDLKWTKNSAPTNFSGFLCCTHNIHLTHAHKHKIRDDCCRLFRITL